MNKTKMKKITYCVFSAMVLLVPVLVGAQWDPTTVEPSETGLTEKEFPDILLSVVNWILMILAILAVLMIIVAGIIYLTSGGNEDRIGTAKKIIIYAIVGLIIALISLAIVRVIDTILRSP